MLPRPISFWLQPVQCYVVVRALDRTSSSHFFSIFDYQYTCNFVRLRIPAFHKALRLRNAPVFFYTIIGYACYEKHNRRDNFTTRPFVTACSFPCFYSGQETVMIAAVPAAKYGAPSRTARRRVNNSKIDQLKSYRM